jgi:hypothetical protein
MFEYRGMTSAVRGLPEPVRGADLPEASGRLMPVLPALAPLFPAGGIRRGSTVTVHGSASLLVALLAGPSQASWCAVVGLPTLGLVAAAEAGVSLRQLALVSTPGAEWPSVVAALIDTFDVVAVAPHGQVVDGVARRLAARARQRGAVLVSYGPVAWPGADLRLSVGSSAWEGLGDGHGYLRARQVELQGEGRGSAAHVRRTWVWLPAPGGGVAPAPAPLAPAIPLPARRRPVAVGAG